MNKKWSPTWSKLLGSLLAVFIGLGLAITFANGAMATPQPTPEGNLLVNTLEDELNTDGDCSLREAVEAANTNAAVDACPAGDGVITDTITFEVAGTITVTSQLSVTAGGPLVIDGGEIITTSGGGMTRVWWVETGSEVTLQRLAVVDGTACLGGAIRNNGRLTILESTFTNNHSTGEECVGGAIANVSAPLIVIDSTFAGNSASGAGGAVFNGGGTVTVTNSTLTGNSAEVGGGIHNFEGTLAVTSSILEENNANQAGGIANSLGLITIDDSVLSGNSASDGGGGALCNWDGDVTVTNTTLSGNSAYGNPAYGGAICNYTGMLNVTDSTLSGNWVEDSMDRYGGRGGAVFNGGMSTVTGCTLIENDANGFEGGGGALYNTGTLTVANSTLSENSADGLDGSGGALYNTGTLTVTNSILSENSALGANEWIWGGGAFYNNGTSIVSNSTLSGNSAIHGGAIYNQNTMTVTNSSLFGNRAYSTGGAITNTGMLMIINSTLSENDAIDGGGAISNDILLIANSSSLSGNNESENGGALYNYGTLTIIDSTLSGNITSRHDSVGGAIRNFGTFNMANSTLSGNISSYSGGALWNRYGTLTVTNSTIYGNRASFGGALYNDSESGAFTLANSIVDYSLSQYNCYGTFIDGGHNISSDNSCGFDPANGSMPNTDPLLGSLQYNGGATWTHALLDGSPAIDAGDDVLCPETDQRGIPRPLDGNGDGEQVCDIGSFERELEDGVYLHPSQQDASANPGVTLQYTLQLYNLTAFTDTFSLALGPHAWETSLSTDRIGPLPSGVSQTFTASVTIPADAPWYLTDTVVITAASVTSPTIYSDTARITSQAYALPEISLFPHALEATLYSGEDITQTLTISNGNGVTLTFDIAKAADWLSVEPASGEVGSSSSIPIQVFLDTAELSVGVYTDNLVVSSNDPDEPLIEVPVTMTVVDLPIEGLAVFNDSPTLLGEVTTLSATVSAGTNVVFTWDFGDGELVSGQVVTHVYPAVDVYTATVTAENSAGSVTATTQVVVQDVPIEELTAFNDSPTLLGTPTTLSATVSAGTNVTYAWDFGNGETGSGQVVTHTYAAVGIYTATVTATNTANSLSETTVVTITAETPSYWQYLPFTVKSQAMEVESQAASQSSLRIDWLFLGVAGVLCTAAQSGRQKCR